jgi:hypothetical protein
MAVRVRVCDSASRAAAIDTSPKRPSDFASPAECDNPKKKAEIGNQK